ncbi:MAG: hypothetical protein OXH96_03705 [Spirochaetaceae bacterium]|nr:hypothetical protein [Spirochaetaceae bacterium]
MQPTDDRLGHLHNDRVSVGGIYRCPRQFVSRAQALGTFGEVTQTHVALIGKCDVIGGELPAVYQAARLTVRVQGVANALTNVENIRERVGRFPAFRQVPGVRKPASPAVRAESGRVSRGAGEAVRGASRSLSAKS